MVRGRIVMAMEFTCTATCRPGVFRESLESFNTLLRGVDLAQSTLFINVDPIPDGVNPNEVISVAEKYFWQVIANAPSESCFPAAVKWCWQQPAGDFFMHLEDDWRLQEPIEVGDLLGELNRNPALSVVNLRAYGHDDDRICLAPGLWRQSHAAEIAERLVTTKNPEDQLRKFDPISRPYGGKHNGFIGLQFPRERTRRVIVDIGRPWLANAGYQRDGGKRFTRWVSVEKAASPGT